MMIINFIISPLGLLLPLLLLIFISVSCCTSLCTNNFQTGRRMKRSEKSEKLNNYHRLFKTRPGNEVSEDLTTFYKGYNCT